MLKTEDEYSTLESYARYCEILEERDSTPPGVWRWVLLSEKLWEIIFSSLSTNSYVDRGFFLLTDI